MLNVRRSLLAVLSAWHGLAAFKNLCDLAAAFELAPGAARFGSKNFAAMEKLLAPLAPPRALLGLLLAGVVGIETAIALAFARRRVELGTALAVRLVRADRRGDGRLPARRNPPRDPRLRADRVPRRPGDVEPPAAARCGLTIEHMFDTIGLP